MKYRETNRPERQPGLSKLHGAQSSQYFVKKL